MHGLEELQKRAFGICAGDDSFGGNFFAAGECDTRHGAIFDEDARDFGVGTNFGTGLLRGGGKSVGKSSRASFDLHVAAIRQAARSTAKQKKRSCAGGPWARSGAENSASGDRGTKEFRFEKFGDEIGNGHGAPANQALHVFLVQASKGFSGPKEIPDVARGGPINVGRRHEKQIAYEGTRGIESFGEFDVSGGVGFGESGDCGDVRKSAGVEEERAAVGMRREEASGRFEELNAVAFELHVFGDARCERAVDGVENRSAEAGMKFLSYGSATNGTAAFEDERLVSGAGKIKRGYEGILAGADDDDVTRVHCY
jgi:hypothetical protein